MKLAWLLIPPKRDYFLAKIVGDLVVVLAYAKTPEVLRSLSTTLAIGEHAHWLGHVDDLKAVAFDDGAELDQERRDDARRNGAGWQAGRRRPCRTGTR